MSSLPPLCCPHTPGSIAHKPNVDSILSGSLPSKPHPRAGYWSGSCLVNLILSLLSCSERRWGSLAAFLSRMTGSVPVMTLDTAPPRLKASSAESLCIKHRHSVACLLSKSLAWRVSLVGQLAFGGWVLPTFSDLASCTLGFLQRTNSLEEKSRLVSAFRERQSSKNLLSSENSDPGGRFRRTETDFSNLFAQGGSSPNPTQLSQFVLIFFSPEILFLSPTNAITLCEPS